MSAFSASISLTTFIHLSSSCALTISSQFSMYGLSPASYKNWVSSPYMLHFTLLTTGIHDSPFSLYFFILTHINLWLNWKSAKAISYLIFCTWFIMNGKMIVSHFINPSLTCCIKFAAWLQIHKRVEVCVHIKMICIKEIITKMFTDWPLQSKELKFRAVILCFCSY